MNLELTLYDSRCTGPGEAHGGGQHQSEPDCFAQQVGRPAAEPLIEYGRSNYQADKGVYRHDGGQARAERPRPVGELVHHDAESAYANEGIKGP